MRRPDFRHPRPYQPDRDGLQEHVLYWAEKPPQQSPDRDDNDANNNKNSTHQNGIDRDVEPVVKEEKHKRSRSAEPPENKNSYDRHLRHRPGPTYGGGGPVPPGHGGYFHPFEGGGVPRQPPFPLPQGNFPWPPDPYRRY